MTEAHQARQAVVQDGPEAWASHGTALVGLRGCASTRIASRAIRSSLSASVPSRTISLAASYRSRPRESSPRRCWSLCLRSQALVRRPLTRSTSVQDDLGGSLLAGAWNKFARSGVVRLPSQILGSGIKDRKNTYEQRTNPHHQVFFADGSQNDPDRGVADPRSRGGHPEHHRGGRRFR